ncbi:hypothetical protein [Paenibacillus qinlingensis]|uniref:hypothetical protein n=1 Tax=Paenibacillus qinlingensis TaxID=1837343 RepID=UPI003B8A840D
MPLYPFKGRSRRRYFFHKGTEPTHARTREELANPNMRRGYELWLMREAKKRNPKIKLDILQWGAPGWINDLRQHCNYRKSSRGMILCCFLLFKYKLISLA